MWSIGRSSALVRDEALPLPLEIRPMRSARTLRLRLDEARMVLKLTCPARMSRKAALRWASEQREWIDQQLARSLPGEPLLPGATIPIEGCDSLLVWAPDLPRTPRLDDGRLACGGPIEAFPGRIERFLRRRALDLLKEETGEYAAKVGVDVKSVSVGDAGTRWGSCSSDKRIRYSWRLVLAPPQARRYVVAHEVAHLVHLNHGADFKRLESELFTGDLAAAKATLKLLGPRLKRIGRGH